MSRLRDVSGLPSAGTLDLWEPTLIARKEIEADVERFAAIPRPENGRRASIFVHPRATAPGWGLAPGIRVTLSVLKPGERTALIRHNSTQVNFCIRGSGMTEIAGRSIAYRQFDVWNTPSYQTYMPFNDGNGLQARLAYSNAPLLEMLNIHIVDDDPPLGLAAVRDPGEDAARDEPVYELTVEDQPLDIAMESRLWQEDLDHPAALLGSETGVGTTRSHPIAAE